MNQIKFNLINFQEKAYIKQCEQESEDSISPISSPVASRVAVLTPPKSSSKKP